jgi:hypothetical protein
VTVWCRRLGPAAILGILLALASLGLGKPSVQASAPVTVAQTPVIQGDCVDWSSPTLIGCTSPITAYWYGPMYPTSHVFPCPQGQCAYASGYYPFPYVDRSPGNVTAWQYCTTPGGGPAWLPQNWNTYGMLCN